MKTLMLICICFFLGCSKNGLFKDDELSLEKESYEGESLESMVIIIIGIILAKEIDVVLTFFTKTGLLYMEVLI